MEYKIYPGMTGAIELAIRREYYEKTTKYSTTDFNKSVRAYILQSRHREKIREAHDPQKRLWSMIGQIGHKIAERSAQGGYIVEKRFASLVGGIFPVSGQIDFFDPKTGELVDYKFIKTWSLVFKSSFEDWKRQAEINTYLMKCENSLNTELSIYGYKVKNIKIQCMLRDWSEQDYMLGRYDIGSDLMVVDFGEPTGEIDGIPTDEYIMQRCNEFEDGEKLADRDLPLCDAKYRWADTDVYKIYWNESTAKKKKSQRNCSTRKEAVEYCEKLNNEMDGKRTYSVGHVAGNEYRRCKYCDAANYCNQFLEGAKNV